MQTTSLPLKAVPSVRADVITCALEAGLPADLDTLAASADPARAFLRRAWYKADAGFGLCTLLARRRDGTPVVAIPTRPFGPMVMRARAVSSSYWPFRSFPMAKDATDAEIAALLDCAIIQRALGPTLRIGPVYNDDPAVVRLSRVAQSMGWTVITRVLGQTFIQDVSSGGAGQAVGQAWASKSRQRKVRAYERKLEEAHGPLTVRTFSGPDWNPAVVADLRMIEANSWVGTTTDLSGAKFLNPANLAHWQTAISDSVLAQQLSATILYASGKPIAFSFDLRSGNVQYGIASSYHETMAKFSPGQIVTQRLIARSIAHGVTSIDWGSGDSGYKRALGAEPGAQIIDLLFVRGQVLAAALKPRWEMTGESGSKAISEGFAASLGEINRSNVVRFEHVLLPGLALAAAAAALTE